MQKPRFGPYIYRVVLGDNGVIPPTSARHWIYEKSMNPNITERDRSWVHIASFLSWTEAREYVAAKRAASEEIAAQFELYYELERSRQYA
jgi:hypothetical protein